ncbi:MAG: hypothetical protein J0H27_04965 [Xanthomonadales bacterium]|nr:hypothetical protein [Xanthomonadales bacterium]
MQTRTFLNLTLAIGAAFGVATHGLATERDAAATLPAPARSALSEIPDPELAAMRGRFVIGNNTVAYFGVTMASSWTTVGGQELNGSVVLGMHFDHGDQTPVITFTPTMNIVQGTPLPATHTDGGTRSVDGSGLANVNGLVQGIQVAGDGNRAVNVTVLRVGQGTDGSTRDATASATAPFDSQVSSGDARVAVAFDPGKGVSLVLGVNGQGLVSQWIRSGSVGQLVQLTSDGQSVNNQLRLDLVLGGAAQSNQALRAASQALLQSRLVGTGG